MITVMVKDFFFVKQPSIKLFSLDVLSQLGTPSHHCWCHLCGGGGGGCQHHCLQTGWSPGSLTVAETSPAKTTAASVGQRRQSHQKWCFHSAYVSLPLSVFGNCLRALMIMAEAKGATSTWACLCYMVTLIVILTPFQSPVALTVSSPILF